MVCQVFLLQAWSLPGLLLTEIETALTYLCISEDSGLFGSHFSGASCETCLVHYFSGQCVNSLYVCIGPGNSALFTILIKKENEQVTHWPSSWHPPDTSFQWATNENEVELLIKKEKNQELMRKIKCTHPTTLLLPQEDLGSAQNFQLLRDNSSKEIFSISVEVDIHSTTCMVQKFPAPSSFS